MGNNEKGENDADLPTLGEVAEIVEKKSAGDQLKTEAEDALSKRTLKIWDVPTELANKFIATAKGSYANKSWLYLQDLMRKANLFDEMVSSGRLSELENAIQNHDRRLANLEEFAHRINELLVSAQKEEGEKQPKTFGRD